MTSNCKENVYIVCIQAAAQRAATGGGGQTGPNQLNPSIEKSIDAYKRLNRLLSAFIDHVSRLNQIPFENA